jgi:hypothetical protein
MLRIDYFLFYIPHDVKDGPGIGGKYPVIKSFSHSILIFSPIERIPLHKDQPATRYNQAA